MTKIDTPGIAGPVHAGSKVINGQLQDKTTPLAPSIVTVATLLAAPSTTTEVFRAFV